MRVSIWEWISFTVIAGMVIMGIVTLKPYGTAKPPACRCSAIQQELDQLRQETRQQDKQIALAILNTAYPPEYTDDYYIGSIEQTLGCHDCHGKATKGEE
jgi:hypothetical protein